VPFTAFRPGYALAETWHATSVLHRLRLLRAFRCYPSRVSMRCIHALGMRRACVSMVRKHRSDSVARSTPTALQERPYKFTHFTQKSIRERYSLAFSAEKSVKELPPCCVCEDVFCTPIALISLRSIGE